MQIPIESIRATRPTPNKSSNQSKWTFSAVLNLEISLTGQGLPSKLKASFYRELHLMFSTGVDIKRSLELFSTDVKKEQHRKIFENITSQVVNGASLSEALHHSGKFSNYEFANIRIGEESGTLRTVLDQLANHYKSKIAQQRQLIGALSYPILVLITSIGAVGFMLQVVVPMFEDVFKRFGSELPWLTKMIVASSEFLRDGFWFFFTLLAITSFTAFVNRKKGWYRSLTSALMLRIPFFGQIVKSSQLSKFSGAMYLLISAHHPLVQSLALVKDMIGYYPLEQPLEQAESDLVRGLTLSESLQQSSFFPRKFIALIKMAEEVNKLDQVFLQLMEQYNEDVAYRSGLLSNVLEPILIIFIGSMVGIILIAMYLPLFSLSTSIG